MKCFNNYYMVNNNDNSSVDDIYYLNVIKEVIINHFEEIGCSFDYVRKFIMNKVLDHPKHCPKSLNKDNDYDYIYLNVKKYSYWCQVIYQLSHELGHSFCNSNNYRDSVPWIEETICEALSLYFLNYFYENWNDIELSKINKNYYISIKEYIEDILNDKGTNRLSDCSSLDELIDINKSSTNNREDRHNEMIKLFKLMDKDNINSLIKYRDYVIDNSILLDTKNYLKKYSNDAVKYLCELQDSVL